MFRDLPCQGKQVPKESLALRLSFLKCLTFCLSLFISAIVITSCFLSCFPYSCDAVTSRSLGDAVAHTAGVSSEPEFTERELDPIADKFLVVATDGLWEFVENNETIQMTEAQKGPTEAVDVMVKESSMRWMREEQVIDDTTIIVANLFNYKAK